MLSRGILTIILTNDSVGFITFSIVLTLGNESAILQGKGEAAMTMEQKIKMALAYRDMSQAALAREIGMTPSNFNQKLKRNTFTDEELRKMAEALGACYIPASFDFPDGTKI